MASSLRTVKALMLNASYEPMRVVSWQKALVLWFQDKVDIVEYHTAFAKSVQKSFQLPSIVKLRAYIRPRNHAVRFSRENVYIRDDYTCQYCGDRLHPKQLTLDHVVPASKQGKKSWTNVVAACRHCNQRKADRTPDEASMPLLSQPRLPNWLPVVDFDFNPRQVPSAWLPYISPATE